MKHSARRVILLAFAALREAAHLRLAWALGLAVAVLGAGFSLLREFNFGAEEARFAADFAQGTLQFWGAALVVLLVASFFFGGLERRALPLLLVRGVRRWEWLLANLLAVWASATVLALLVAGSLGVALTTMGVRVPWMALSVALAPVAVQLLVMAAASLAICTACRGLPLAVMVSIGFWIAAQMMPAAEWARLHEAGISRILWTAVVMAAPDFHGMSSAGGWRTLLGGAGYTAGYFCCACVLFSRREL